MVNVMVDSRKSDSETKDMVRLEQNKGVDGNPQWVDEEYWVEGKKKERVKETRITSECICAAANWSRPLLLINATLARIPELFCVTLLLGWLLLVSYLLIYFTCIPLLLFC